MWVGNGSHTIRDLKYTIENPRHFVDSHHETCQWWYNKGKDRYDSGGFSLFAVELLEVHKTGYTSYPWRIVKGKTTPWYFWKELSNSSYMHQMYFAELVLYLFTSRMRMQQFTTHKVNLCKTFWYIGMLKASHQHPPITILHGVWKNNQFYESRRQQNKTTLSVSIFPPTASPLVGVHKVPWVIMVYLRSGCVNPVPSLHPFLAAFKACSLTFASDTQDWGVKEKQGGNELRRNLSGSSLILGFSLTSSLLGKQSSQTRAYQEYNFRFRHSLQQNLLNLITAFVRCLRPPFSAIPW